MQGLGMSGLTDGVARLCAQQFMPGLIADD
jgi:hypothetical protein